MKIILGIIIFCVTVFPAFAIEVTAPNGNTPLPSIVTTSPDVAIAAIIRFFLLMTWVLAVMAITWWGIGFVLSTGDDEKMKKSRKTIIYAFVWLVVAGLAYAIVSAITRMQLN